MTAPYGGTYSFPTPGYVTAVPVPPSSQVLSPRAEILAGTTAVQLLFPRHPCTCLMKFDVACYGRKLERFWTGFLWQCGAACLALIGWERRLRCKQAGQQVRLP
ncbi:hypothetical protein BaRGS_00019390 [Batillaria attramentaria]|uniref:Uncharacterized protein n=1 Tax=Batillaria attramentaria TaxID=370345 RepID=A0ABD0KQX8_9CAEN